MHAEHAQILMAQVDSYVTWGSDGTKVCDYSDGSATTEVGGCGWHVTDGPDSWYDANGMPYDIYNYGWAYFESCSPTVNGWLQADAWGDYDSGYGSDCDYDIQVPYGSSLQCYAPALLY